MITLRKLTTLKESTRRRKYPLILQKIEGEIKNNETVNFIYFKGLLHMILEDDLYSEKIKSDIHKLESDYYSLNLNDLLWKCNSLRYQLLSSIGAEPGDWDFEDNSSINRSKRVIGDFVLYLDGIRSPFNVGSIFRSAESFGIKKILISRDTASPEHSRAKRSSMGCTDIIPWDYSSLQELDTPIFALELGGVDLDQFQFPAKGTLIIGSEELGVSPEAINVSDSSLGRISINTGGIKGSINVSVATGITLQKWYSSIS